MIMFQLIVGIALVLIGVSLFVINRRLGKQQKSGT
jgi:HAMP domain-containing protein